MAPMIDRRQFLKVSAAGSGGLLLGFSLFACKKPESDKTPEGSKTTLPADPRLLALTEPMPINAFVRLDPNDTITMIVPQTEMGQGILTSLAMILAEELDVDWTKVRSEHAPADKAKYGFQLTGGSNSVRGGFENLRKAGAAAREMLVAAAAKTWGVPADECRVEQGVIVHEKGQKRATYGELASTAVTMTVPESPKLKERKDFRIIGKPVKRIDTPDKTRGKAIFGIDVKRDGMLIAQVAHSPVFGGKAKSFDATKAKAVPGVRDVIEIPTGIAVVADHYWAAKKGRDALEIQWDEGPMAQLSNASITEMLRKELGNGREARKEGDAAKVLASAKKKLQAVYEVPYLAHAAMEPMNATAEVRADSAELWVSTQSPSLTQSKAAEITGLAEDKITVHTTMLGGGFGRRACTDSVADAVHVAKATGKPIKVVWSREDDTRGGFYRPVAYNELSGSLDDEGWPNAWVHRISSPSIIRQLGSFFGRPFPPDAIDPTSIEGAANLPYAIPNIHVTCAEPAVPIPIWFWRSVGSSQNGYITECFFDELAALGGKDPVEARLRLLDKHPRHKRVLEMVAEKSGWGTAPPQGMARGVAVHECFGSIVAEVAEVSIENKAVKVHRVVAAIDCGDVVNPNTIEAQVESAIVYGLSAALWGKVDIDKGRPVQSNFHDYRVLRMNEMPKIETYIAASGDPLGGVGEPGTPPIAPAVCNALRVLTGKPIRKLPIQIA